MKKRSLYILLLGFCLVSYGWLFFNWHNQASIATSRSTCFFKNVTTVPCPACGTTRSVLAIYEGKIAQAILLNPLGVFAFILLMFTPFWLAYDAIYNKSSLYAVYRRMEIKLKNKFVALPLIAIVFANWIWNIMKGL